MLLIRGVLKLPRELAAEGATPRIADLLRTAWVHGMLGNLCVAVVLLLVAPRLSAQEPLARQIAAAIGVYYVLLGAATYAFAQTHHAGMLVFALLGVILLATLWWPR